MTPEKNERNGQQGFTILELVIVVAIIGILAAIGYSVSSNLLPRYRTQQAANRFADDVNNLRASAIADNREYRIELIDYDEAAGVGTGDNVGEWWLEAGDRSSGSNSWEILPVDADDDEADDFTNEGMVIISKGGAQELPDVSLAAWPSLAGPTYAGDSCADSIVFSPRGWVVNPNSDFGASGYITLTFVNKAALRRGVTENFSVNISRSGMARVDINSVRYESTVDNAQGIDQRSQEYSNASAGEE